MKTEDFAKTNAHVCCVTVIKDELKQQCVGGRACRGCVTICEPSVFPNTSAIKKCDTRNRMIMGFIYGVRVRVCVCVIQVLYLRT